MAKRDIKKLSVNKIYDEGETYDIGEIVVVDEALGRIGSDGKPHGAVHNSLNGRDKPDSHPMSSITNLEEELNSVNIAIETETQDRKQADIVLQEGMVNIIDDNNTQSLTTTLSSKRIMDTPVKQSVNRDKFVVVEMRVYDGGKGYKEGESIFVNDIECRVPKVGLSYPKEYYNMPSTAYWQGIAYGNGKFAAIAFDSDKAAYSEDGETWFETTLPSTAGWYSVIYGKDRFVAVAANHTNKGAYSYDGITWVETTMPFGNWRGAAYGDGIFVAVGEYMNIAAYSYDGINWVENTVSPFNNRWSSVTYGDGKFVAVAWSSDRAAYSYDGITWVETAIPHSGWRGVTYGNGKFVAIGAYGGTVYSTDGINWVDGAVLTNDHNQEFTFVAFCGDMFIAPSAGFSQSGIAFYSYDGITWESNGYLWVQYPTSAAYGNGKLIVTADSSNIVVGLDTGSVPDYSLLYPNDVNKIYDTDPSGWHEAVGGSGSGMAVGIHTSWSKGIEDIESSLRYVSQSDPLIQKSHFDLRTRALSMEGDNGGDGSWNWVIVKTSNIVSAYFECMSNGVTEPPSVQLIEEYRPYYRDIGVNGMSESGQVTGFKISWYDGKCYTDGVMNGAYGSGFRASTFWTVGNEYE